MVGKLAVFRKNLLKSYGIDWDMIYYWFMENWFVPNVPLLRSGPRQGWRVQKYVPVQYGFDRLEE
ncbi:MAG: hypothetical protein NTW95_03995 [Candidatus Aminicenantes bacterium]|nr:hypothetical protein [Candidatus Aminicenantes bacterium]